MKSGSKLFKQTTEHTLESTEIFSKFKGDLENIPNFYAQNSTPWVDKILHTIDNDFLKNVSLPDSIATGKGTNAKVMLRDKLKATAADTQSRA